MPPRNEQERLLERLRGHAREVGASFGLVPRSVRWTRRDAKVYGVCDIDGNIRIRLRSLVTGKPLKYSSLVSTLCHEMAHLRHFHHGRDFSRLYRALLGRARALGIYQPARTGRPAPRLGSGRVRVDVAASVRPRTPRGAARQQRVRSAATPAPGRRAARPSGSAPAPRA
ncbi:MAG: DUF45 domain-containing protein [Acidobacteria bacterium]|nr:DUF45 domain-containing protein [Acidobacteriota bacterium]